MDKEFAIIIAEPWDFENPDGQNRIIGKIKSILNNKCIVFESNCISDFGNDIRGHTFILSPRFKDGNFNNIENKNVEITVNGGVLLVEYKRDMNTNELLNNCKFALIGTLIRMV